MKKKTSRPNSINVLAPTATGNRLWQFSDDGGKPKVSANVAVPVDKPAPSKLTAKSWTTLWQPRVNIGWLPAGEVFLRVVQLPQADSAELASMLEFQLEKLSPLPVAQIVWSFEIVPSREINNITAIVIIAARDVVEEKLGVLEQGGFQPDRLELPHVYQLISDIPETDGVSIYPWNEGGKEFCLAAWWFTGTMRNLQLIHLPATGDRMGLLKTQLMNTAWAGEMEGWLNFPIRWRVVAPPGTADEWRSAFATWEDGAVEVTEQPPQEKLAEFAARRTLVGDGSANLLPPEFTARYRQQFIDRLWMRALGAAMAVYAVAVVAYALAVYAMRFKVSSVQKQITGISQTYTNTLKLREEVQVLQDQLNLKFAALDSMKTASDLLPTEVTLGSMILGRGQTLELRGTAENAKALADYNDAMRNATVGGQPLFKGVSPPSSSARHPSGLAWAFNADLNREEIK